MWGTYDLGKPRTRILIRGLKEAGVDLVECHADVWRGVEDKAQIQGWLPLLRCAARLLLAYPVLVWRYLRLPRHDVVVVGYLGHLDVLVLWPFAKLRRTPVLWDAFLSLYETVVEDRAMIGPRHPLAWIMWAWDWLACRAARQVLLDTSAHADWFESTFRLGHRRTAAVFVGAEPETFAPLPPGVSTFAARKPVRILFYGQFIPLHGIETIVEAAARSDPDDYAWTVIGTGQEADRIRRMLERRAVANLTWIPWVPYEDLRARIAEADICLGIFGLSGKAARVIPNKVFQIIAAGRPLVTRDSPAMRELVQPDVAGIRLVKAADPDALLAGIADLMIHDSSQPVGPAFNALRERITPAAIGLQLRGLVSSLAAGAVGNDSRSSYQARRPS